MVSYLAFAFSLFVSHLFFIWWVSKRCAWWMDHFSCTFIYMYLSYLAPRWPCTSCFYWWSSFTLTFDFSQALIICTYTIILRSWFICLIFCWYTDALGNLYKHRKTIWPLNAKTCLWAYANNGPDQPVHASSPLRTQAYSNIYWKFYHQKTKNFQTKNSDIFHISA